MASRCGCHRSRSPLRAGKPPRQPGRGRRAQPRYRCEHLPGHIGALAVQADEEVLPGQLCCRQSGQQLPAGNPRPRALIGPIAASSNPSNLADRAFANTIIAGQQGTYRHLTARVAHLFADSGLSCANAYQRVSLLTIPRLRHTGRQSGTIIWYEGVMMMAMSASEARKRLFPLIEQVNDDQEPVEIVSKAGTAYLVSADQWRSLMETAHLLRSPVNAERLLRSIADAEASRTEVQELLDPQHDVA